MEWDVQKKFKRTDSIKIKHLPEKRSKEVLRGAKIFHRSYNKN